MYCTVVARLAWRRWCCWIRIMWYMGNIIRRSQVLKSRPSTAPHLRTQWIGGTDALLSLQFCIRAMEGKLAIPFEYFLIPSWMNLSLTQNVILIFFVVGHVSKENQIQRYYPCFLFPSFSWPNTCSTVCFSSLFLLLLLVFSTWVYQTRIWLFSDHEVVVRDVR